MRAHTIAVIGFLTLPVFAQPASAEVTAEPAQWRPQAQDEMRFRGMDANGDGRITRAEWRGNDRSFRNNDWNNDGVLSGDEVRVGATRPNRQGGAAAEDDFFDWTDAGFRDLDRNRDGRINRSEWQYDAQTFTRADRNRDNVLSRSEFLGYDSEEDVAGTSRFDELDVNNNGRIERREWQGTREAFDWLDRNNDGWLSRAETVDNAVADAQGTFASYDVDRNGTIEADEWPGTRRSFDLRDRNGDGRLTRAEAGELPTTDVPAAQGTFASYDVDRNGTIEADEWPGTRRSFDLRDRNGDGRLTRAEAGELASVGTSDQSTPGAADRIAVNAETRWTDTGIDVRSGDRLQVRAQGTISLSGNDSGNDTAGPAGAFNGRRASGAPLPSAPAGALIARIGDGPVFLIGAEGWTNRAGQSGRLFLGVNDDHLGDNRGEFTVRVSITR
jgi:hypothetical protein